MTLVLPGSEPSRRRIQLIDLGADQRTELTDKAGGDGRSGLEAPTEVIDATADYRAENDLLGAYIEP